MKMNQKKKGFTLIELIVVIAILGILAAIAVPRLIGFQDRARQQADNQVAAQVKNTMALLYANGEVFVPNNDGVPGVNENDIVAFDVDTTAVGTATVTYAAGDTFTQRDLTTNIANTAVADLIDGLMTDINIQGTRVIHVTVNGAGAVSAVLQ